MKATLVFSQILFPTFSLTLSPKSLPGLESDGRTYADSLASGPASVLGKGKYIQP